MAEKHRLEENALAEQRRAADAKLAEERFNAQKEALKRQNDTLEAQRALLDQVKARILTVTDPSKWVGGLKAFFDTFDGKLRELGYNVQKIFENFGNPLIDALKPFLDTVNGQWAPALQKLGTDFGNAIVNEAQLFWNAFTKGDWGPIIEQGRKALGDIANFFIDTLTKTDWSSVFKALGGITQKIISDLGDVLKKFGEILEAVFSGPAMQKALEGLTKLLNDVATSFAGALIAALREQFKGGPMEFLLGSGKPPEPQKGFNQLVKEHKDALKDTADKRAYEEGRAKERIIPEEKPVEQLRQGVGEVIDQFKSEIAKKFPPAPAPQPSPSPVAAAPPPAPTPTTTTPAEMPAPPAPGPEAAEREARRIDDAIRQFFNFPENQKQTSLLQELNNNLKAVLTIA